MAGKSQNSSKSKSKASGDDFKPEPQPKKGHSGVPFYKDARNRRIVGLILLTVAICALIAMISHLYHWHTDISAVTNSKGVLNYLLHGSVGTNNKLGPIGAIIGFFSMNRGFGLLSLLLIPLLLGLAFNLLQSKYRFANWRYFKNASLLVLIGSPLLSFLFRNFAFSYGGAYGELIVTNLTNMIGSIGTGLILSLAVLVAIVYIFNPTFTMPDFSKWRLPSKPNLPADHNATAAMAIDGITKANEQNEAIEYESKEAEIFIHQQDAAVEEQTQIQNTENTQQHILETLETKSSKELEAEPELDVEADTKSVTSNKIELSNTTSNNTQTVSELSEQVGFEVVQKEEEVIADLENVAIHDTNELYDPSLELSNYEFPHIDLLEDRGIEKVSVSSEELEANKNQIITTLKSFGISISKISATVGPTVTLYEIVPAEGVRISKIRNLEDDIALSLAALGIRIIAPIPGKGTIGIEVPNLKKQTVSMRTLIASEKFVNTTAQLPIALGKKIDNENYVVDLATMPHLLMAGATGQGKSVGLNTILVSLLYKKHPSQLKFVLVDPKKVELSIYKTIEKHFLARLPNEDDAIITDTKKVINTLNSLCIEMDQRYDLLKEASVRNIAEYNDKFIRRRLNPQKGHRYLPFIVLVVDEFADLILTAGKEVEMPIARLAQLARAIGIHLIIATQRPSVNIITGTIKANFPARIAFRVSAKVDSRTILDTGGADQLIGKGDMLVNIGGELVRLQCAFVDTPEVERIAEFIGEQQGYASAYELPEYIGPESDEMAVGGKVVGELDELFEQCARLVVSSQSGSTSMLQRRFNLGYNRAGRIMDQLEGVGIVGATVAGKQREVLVKTEAELESIISSFGPQ